MTCWSSKKKGNKIQEQGDFPDTFFSILFILLFFLLFHLFCTTSDRAFMCNTFASALFLFDFCHNTKNPLGNAKILQMKEELLCWTTHTMKTQKEPILQPFHSQIQQKKKKTFVPSKFGRPFPQKNNSIQKIVNY